MGMPDFQIERKILSRGYKNIAGLDEAGRGALFGPVVSGAVMFSSSLISAETQGWVKEINDSKLLSPKKRKNIFRSIMIHACGVGYGFASNTEIEKENIYWASLMSMKRAVKNLSVTPDFVLVDGFELNDVDYHCERIVKGDKKSYSIAAASIVAKVLRDEMIVQLSKIYREYSLEKNKGYGTKEHYLALERFGPTSLHRKTFNLVNNRK
jgi:ribonuclease HII